MNYIGWFFLKKQKSLFDSIEPNKKLKKKVNVKDIKPIEKEKESRLILEKPVTKDEIIPKTKKVLKNDIYSCDCGLKMNWKIAEARKECPQCNLIIKESDLFDVIEIL